MIMFYNLLSERNLQARSGASIFARGASYYRLARVQVKYADSLKKHGIIIELC